jgi:uncharacterized protein (DUF924 family)
MSADQARAVRDFWFGRLPLTAEGLEQRMQLWFGEDGPPRTQAARDELIRTRFGALTEQAERGELDAWAGGPRRRLSLILLTDQFPRHIYRGSARAFATDARALHLSLTGMQSGADAALDPVERIFFYMPLQHAESLEVQEESVAAFRRLKDEAPEELRPAFTGTLAYALEHRSVIERFGRFPARNQALDRTSTPDEIAFLAGSG